MIKHAIIAILLTILTQLGGIAWLAALRFRARLAAFALFYAALTIAAIWVAPLTGRQALDCRSTGPLQVQNWVYCLTNRNYVTPVMHAALTDLARDLAAEHPGTVTQMLDANFPFLNGFPLLPHLSHDDGQKADVAFFYADAKGYLPAQTRSPIGYFAYEPGTTPCPTRWFDMRWDLAFIQPLWHDWKLDTERMKTALRLMASDPRLGKILLEPHLKQSLGVQSAKIRFQGCFPARHDDHFHIQL